MAKPYNPQELGGFWGLNEKKMKWRIYHLGFEFIGVLYIQIKGYKYRALNKSRTLKMHYILHTQYLRNMSFLKSRGLKDIRNPNFKQEIMNIK